MCWVGRVYQKLLQPLLIVVFGQFLVRHRILCLSVFVAEMVDGITLPRLVFIPLGIGGFVSHCLLLEYLRVVFPQKNEYFEKELADVFQTEKEQKIYLNELQFGLGEGKRWEDQSNCGKATFFDMRGEQK